MSENATKTGSITHGLRPSASENDCYGLNQGTNAILKEKTTLSSLSSLYTHRFIGSKWSLAAFLLSSAATAGAQTTPPAGAPTNAPSELDALRAKIAEQDAFNKQLQERLQRLEAAQSPPSTPPAPAANGTANSNGAASNGAARPTTPSAPAQQSPSPLPPAQPGGVAAPPPVTVGTSSRFPVTISGLFLVQANAAFNEDGPFPKQPSTFRLRRGQLGVSSPITPRVTGNIVFDFAKVGTNGAAPLQSLFLQYLLQKRPSGSNYIDIGSFKVPLGYEGDINNGTVQTVERALMFRQRDQFGGGTSDISDTGAQLRGTFRRFDYRLGLFNGLGERGNQLATSNNKAVVGRVLYRFGEGTSTGRGLTLGLSAATGNSRNALLGATPSLAGRADRMLYNAFMVYRERKIAASAEYMTGRSDFSGDAAAPRDIRSYYASAGYLLTPKIEAVLRYDYYDFDRNFSAPSAASSATSARELTLGFNYYIKGNNARIQINLVRANGGRGLTVANGFTGGNVNSFQNDRTELRTQYQVAF